MAQMATTVIQEAAPVTRAGIFTEMTDERARCYETAERALAYLTEISPDMRGAAILDAEGRFSPQPRPERWAEDARRCWRSPTVPREPVEQVHIATEQGEVFAMRHAGLTAVAVTERFALASLMLFDMRSLLRDLRRRTRARRAV